MFEPRDLIPAVIAPQPAAFPFQVSSLQSVHLQEPQLYFSDCSRFVCPAGVTFVLLARACVLASSTQAAEVNGRQREQRVSAVGQHSFCASLHLL